MKTGEAIKQIRTALGKSQQDFSNEIGVTVTTVSRWETDKMSPDPIRLKQLVILAKSLDMPDAVRQALLAEAGELYGIMASRLVQRVWNRIVTFRSELACLRQDAIRDGWTQATEDRNLRMLEISEEGLRAIEELSALLPAAKNDE